ncbi:MAG TPA: threonylcarbamoyl-AMP synthase, partial [Phycisphaerae bacterium]|nr:threonylcarbamoyl-AMP synthase [Phycisphaerae bacterium]
MIKTQVIHVPKDISGDVAAKKAALALDDGQIVGFPTETVYGLAALASNPVAMKRLRDLKSRPSRPFSVHLGCKSQAKWYVRSMPSEMRRLIDRAWPGPVTIIAQTHGSFGRDDFNAAGLYEVLTQNDTIGMRCPDEPVTARMLSAAGGPVVAPSANLAGKASPRSAADVLVDLDGKIDMLIDTGPTTLGTDSTIVAFRSGKLELLRLGIYDRDAIISMIRRRYLFVCTGNTCRSPMADGIAKAVLAGRVGCSVTGLSGRYIEVLSAGPFAGD